MNVTAPRASAARVRIEMNRPGAGSDVIDAYTVGSTRSSIGPDGGTVGTMPTIVIHGPGVGAGDPGTVGGIVRTRRPIGDAPLMMRSANARLTTATGSARSSVGAGRRPSSRGSPTV